MDGVKLRKVLSLNFKDGQKVKVTPLGDVFGLDGRSFRIDGEMLMAALAKNEVHIPLDVNHGFGEAAGWFEKESFEVREDGLWASLELTPKGRELVESKAYRYLSPVFVMGANSVVLELDSVGLVNRPNLLNKELNEKTDKERKLKELEEFKSEIEALKSEVKALRDADTAKEDIKKTEENFKNEVEVLKTAIKEMNTKMTTVFKKANLEANDKSEGLSENEKKVADLLGVSHEVYAKQKGGN